MKTTYLKPWSIKIRITLAIILGFSLLMFAYIAYADNKHHTYPVDVTVKPSETVILPYTKIETKYSGTALGIANSQLHFDKNITHWQLGVGAGYFDNAEAYAIGAAKRVSNKSMINFSVGREGSGTGYGFGINFTLP